MFGTFWCFRSTSFESALLLEFYWNWYINSCNTPKYEIEFNKKNSPKECEITAFGTAWVQTCTNIAKTLSFRHSDWLVVSTLSHITSYSKQTKKKISKYQFCQYWGYDRLRYVVTTLWQKCTKMCTNLKDRKQYTFKNRW